MFRLAIGRMLLWFILPAAEEKWRTGESNLASLIKGPLVPFDVPLRSSR
jgi:hypothetical protein